MNWCHLDPERNLAIDLSLFWSSLLFLKGPQENRYRILKFQPVPGGNGSLGVMEVTSPPQPHGYGNWLGNPSGLPVGLAQVGQLDTHRAALCLAQVQEGSTEKEPWGLSLQLELLGVGDSPSS